MGSELTISSPNANSRGTSASIAVWGSWYFSAGAARCGRRYTHAREDSGFSLGFRVLRELPTFEGAV